MPIRRGYLAHQNTFIDTVIRKFDGFPGRNFVIGNALSEGCPIIYCNTSFCKLTGYDRHELVQKDCCCDFLYGPDTEVGFKESICEALRNNEEYHTETYYYKKNGERFLCSVIVAPIKNEQGTVIMYIVNHEDVTPCDKGLLSNECLNTDLRKRSINFQISFKRRKSSNASNDHYTSNIFNSFDKNVIDLEVMEECPLKEMSSTPSSPCMDEIDIQISNNVEPVLSSQSSDGVGSPPLNRKISSSSKLRRACSSSLNNLHTSSQEQNLLLCPNHSIVRAISEGNVANNSCLSLSSQESRKPEAPRSFELISAPSLINSAKSNKVAQVMSLGADVLPEYRVESPKIHPWTILHYSPFKAIWDWIVLFLVMYTAIVTPLMAAFVLTSNNGANNMDKHSHDKISGTLIVDDPLVIVDYIVDVMFIIDIFINFRTTFVDSNDEVVSDPCRVAVNYMKNWFIVDLLAAIPFELLIMIGNTDQTTTLIGLLKTARLLRLVRVARKLDRYSEYGTALLLLLIFWFALVAHWLACGWYAIGLLDHWDKEETALGWLDKLAKDVNMSYNTSDSQSGPDVKTAYLTALYFTLSSLTSVGFGNVNANTNNEKAFTIMVMFLGALMHAVIFGNVTAIIQRLYSGMAHYHATMRKVREFIRFYQIPSPLRQRLEDYAQYDYSYTNGIDMTEVLRNFPEGLQADICLHLNRNLLASNAAFRKSTPGCLRSLSLKLTTTHCPPGDYIIHSGDEISHLYWIGRGTVEIMLEDTIIAVLGKNDSFGENFGLTVQRVTGKAKASVRALTYCDLHLISRDDLLDIMKAYPEFRKSFNNEMQITYDLRDLELERKDMQSSMPNLYNIPAVRGEIAERKRSLPNITEQNEFTGLNELDDPDVDEPVHINGPCSSIAVEKSHVRKHGLSNKSNVDCSCASLQEEIQDVKDHIYKLESSLKEDMKLVLELLRSSRQKPSLVRTRACDANTSDLCTEACFDTDLNNSKV